MASNNKDCSICDSEYNDVDTKPLVLPCGHSFCKHCLQTLSGNKKYCPSCRSEWSGDTDKLPICYQLMSKYQPCSKSTFISGICEDHEFEIMFWCSTCKEEACKKCIVQSHEKCKLNLLDEANFEEQITSKDTLEAILSKMKIKKEEIQCSKEVVGETIDSLSKFGGTVKKVEKEFVAQEEEIKSLDLKLTSAIKYFENLDLNESDTESEKLNRDDVLPILNKLSILLPKVANHKEIPLCKIAKIMEMENDVDWSTNLMKLWQSCENYRSANTWIIEDETDASAADFVISVNKLKPNIACFKFTEEMPREGALHLFPNISENATLIELYLMDTFWNYEAQYGNFYDDSKILIRPNNTANPQAKKVKVFIGRLNQHSMNDLLNVQILGQFLHDYVDCIYLNTAVEQLQYIKEIHVSISARRDISNYSGHRLNSSTYNKKQLWMHFPNLRHYDDLVWVQQMIAYHIQDTSVNNRIHRLCLPRCHLTVRGLTRLLGLVEEHELTKCVWIGHHNFSSKEINQLEKQYESDGVTLLTGPDFREAV